MKERNEKTDMIDLILLIITIIIMIVVVYFICLKMHEEIPEPKIDFWRDEHGNITYTLKQIDNSTFNYTIGINNTGNKVGFDRVLEIEILKENFTIENYYYKFYHKSVYNCTPRLLSGLGTNFLSIYFSSIGVNNITLTFEIHSTNNITIDNIKPDTFFGMKLFQLIGG